MMRLRIRIRVRVRVRLWVRIKVRIRVRVGIRVRVMALRVGNHVSFSSTSKTTSNYRFITRIKNDYTIEVKLAIEITIRKFKKMSLMLSYYIPALNLLIEINPNNSFFNPTDTNNQPDTEYSTIK